VPTFEASFGAVAGESRLDGSRLDPLHGAWDRATLDASEDGYTVLRAVRAQGEIVDWLIVDANALVRERWARVVGDVVGTLESRLNDAADNSQFQQLYRRALETGEAQTLELNLELPGAKGGWRRVRVVPVDGDTVSVVTRNISRERALEDALNQERDQRSRHVHVRPSIDPSEQSAIARFARLSATALLVSAGVLSIVNSLFFPLHGVDRPAMLATGCAGLILGLVLLALPWERHYRLVSLSVIGAALALVFGSDFVHHYSRDPAAPTVYSTFCIVVIAWVGLTQRRGAASIVAVVWGAALGMALAHAGRNETALQCVVVAIPVAAALGEVLSWFANRSRELTNLEMQRRLHDPLTGLANRTLLSLRLDHALARARRTAGVVAVMYLDLDGFKAVNDRQGHGFGDELLIEVGNRLRATLRESDTVARMGGDEFVVLCEDVSDRAAASGLAQRILDAVEQPITCGQVAVAVSTSIGIAFAEIADTAELILQRADTALYQAKASGRARFELFDQDLNDHMIAIAELESALRLAAPRDELRLHYQPIIKTSTAEICELEALVRWERPGYGLLPPAAFIEIAERTGLIVEIGSWVLRNACTQAAAWNARTPGRSLGISINVSAKQLRDDGFVAVVRHALEESDIDPRLVTLELTESSVIEAAASIPAVLAELRSFGLNIAIDDFGTGYSSLTHLRQLPVNVIKIDRSFVETLGTERDDTAIVAAVIGLAHNLRFQTIAEGVETGAQAAVLSHLGCDRLQGFLFSKPLPPERIPELLERGRFQLAAHGLEADHA
jgi:diguanylate cyclase (GGDEF)-like protein